ncbi:MAG TPA: hypothetical protein VHF89_15495 [Solirubrobacteraceae bacterium]|nr:hypothetical protein [Solirubrobacteraceae bacterium]
MTTASLLRTALLGLALLAGCGGSGDREEEAAKRLKERGGVRATFGARPESREAIVRILRDRIRARDVDATVRATGADRVELAVADRSPERARDTIATLTAVGRVAFYDWEGNVIGPAGVPSPEDVAVTGGVRAGQAGSLSLHDAVERARRRPAADDGDNTHAGLWYLVDRAAEEVEGPFRTQAEARDRRAAGQRIAHVQPGTVLLRAEDGGGWFVLEDDPALGNQHLVDPRQRVDPRADGEPIVTFDFTDDGRRRFEAVTRELARRGAGAQLPGASPLESAQHFAIALDEEIITVPYVDYEAHPDGIDAENGSQIQGGFTVESAQALAALLRAGPLPPGALVQQDEEVVPPA